MKAGRIKDWKGTSPNLKGCGNCGAFPELCKMHLARIGEKRCWYPVGTIPVIDERVDNSDLIELLRKATMKARGLKSCDTCGGRLVVRCPMDESGPCWFPEGTIQTWNEVRDGSGFWWRLWVWFKDGWT
jgi:hypothetical protein